MGDAGRNDLSSIADLFAIAAGCLEEKIPSSLIGQQDGSVRVVKEISNDVEQFIEQFCGSSRNHRSIFWLGHFEEVTGYREENRGTEL